MSEHGENERPANVDAETSRPLDWDFSVPVGARTTAPQPKVSTAEARQAVAELRAGAERAASLVNDWCELGGEVGLAPLHVVDREGWIRANAQTFADLMDPVVGRIITRPSKGIAHAVGSRMAGAEMGAVLGFLGSRILGQFDPFHGDHGRLLLVAPNIVQVERQLGVDPAVFRLWVCLHEEAHRVQFTSVPWLRAHVRGLIDEMTSHVDSTSFSPETMRRVLDVIKGPGIRSGTPNGDSDRPSAGLAEAFASPAQREVLDRVTGVMSLLEGHADFVMDAVGEQAFTPAQVRDIRRKFNGRRKGANQIDRLVRRLMGLEAKSAQYRDGYRFVEQVSKAVGKAGFNQVFASPENLPSRAEILDPTLWIARVHGA